MLCYFILYYDILTLCRFQKAVELEKIPDMIFGRSHLTFKSLSHPFEYVINPLDAIKGILTLLLLLYLSSLFILIFNLCYKMLFLYNVIIVYFVINY